ncbi:dethiobiotin synthase [Aquimarina hainanensis]|uniref:ATP-dependent dethiobiotin synthetase BioD n=1 Tax=Aquimarina hainanensis TaxID=1578017 RepID=A0ABW5N2H6_9FLAO
MSQNIFITGIGTDVGKTIASAIVVEALKADYFKPVQAGDLHYSDTDKVKELISNTTSNFYENAYALETPMSPHAAAEIDGVKIDIENIKIPEHDERAVVIEGAGGILVPLNDEDTILDIIPLGARVIVVSRHYLGSINHTLMTLWMLKEQGFNVALIYSGKEHKTTEGIIQKMTETPIIGRIDEETSFTPEVIKKYADQFRENLEKL